MPAPCLGNSSIPLRTTERRADRRCNPSEGATLITGCEACSEDAEIPFDNILDRVTGSDPSVTDYVLEVSARCLLCGAEINEKTLVESEQDHQP